jgi:hypothetical protein
VPGMIGWLLGSARGVPSNPSTTKSAGPHGTRCCGSYLVDMQTLATARIYQVCAQCGRKQ